MSAVSNRVMPRSIALWITLREVSRSVRWPKLLQPRPTAETRRPEPPRLRICMDRSCGKKAREEGRHCGPRDFNPQGAELPRRERHGRYLGRILAGISASVPHKKVRPRSDAATDGDRLGRVIRDGGPDQTQVQPSRALLRGGDNRIYPQPG